MSRRKPKSEVAPEQRESGAHSGGLEVQLPRLLQRLPASQLRPLTLLVDEAHFDAARTAASAVSHVRERRAPDQA